MSQKNGPRRQPGAHSQNDPAKDQQSDSQSRARAQAFERAREHRPTTTPVRGKFEVHKGRTANIRKLVQYRHGKLPDTDDALIYLEAAYHHLRPKDGDLEFALSNWSRMAGRAANSDELHDVLAAPQRRLDPDELGMMLRLTEAERAACRITTIKAFDLTEEDREERRRAQARARQERRRRKQEVRPRKNYRANSITAKKPWVAEGVSRSTWYERRRKR